MKYHKLEVAALHDIMPYSLKIMFVFNGLRLGGVLTVLLCFCAAVLLCCR